MTTKTKETKMVPPSEQKDAAENEAYYREWGKQRVDCTIQVANPSADKVIKIAVPDPSKPNKSVPIEILCGERVKGGVPIYAVEQIENAYTVEMKEIPKHRRQGDVGLTYETIRMPMYTVKRHSTPDNPGALVENPAPIGNIKSSIAQR